MNRDVLRCGAGRGSDTTGAAARNSRPTFSDRCDYHYDPLSRCDGVYVDGVCDQCGRPKLIGSGLELDKLDCGCDWVLVEVVASEAQGKTLYFDRYTGIGPMTTPHLDEAARFDSEEHARQSLACAFPLTIFEPRRATLCDASEAANSHPQAEQ